tara:strand:+ start:3420 stop:4343 length:924 start_codon:yes stop_codon:yes gene_type:complete
MQKAFLDVRVGQLDPWQPKVEGVNSVGERYDIVPDPLDVFAFEVQHSIRGIKFGTHNSDRDNKMKISDKYKFAYMDGQPYVLGYICYDDPRDNPQQHEYHYVVCSPYIQNMKYANYSAQMNMRMSVNKESALKHAKAFLRPRSFGNLAKIGYRNIQHGFSRERGKFVEDFRKAREVVGLQNDSLIPELSHLIDMGHNFLDADIHEKVLDLLDKNKLLKADQEKKLNAVFVYAYMRHNVETFNVVDLSGDEVRNYSFDWGSLSVKEYTSDTIPGDIKSKLVSLNMLQGEGFVDDVGYKVGDNMFYVAL